MILEIILLYCNFLYTCMLPSFLFVSHHEQLPFCIPYARLGLSYSLSYYHTLSGCKRACLIKIYARILWALTQNRTMNNSLINITRCASQIGKQDKLLLMLIIWFCNVWQTKHVAIKFKRRNVSLKCTSPPPEKMIRRISIRNLFLCLAPSGFCLLLL